MKRKRFYGVTADMSFCCAKFAGENSVWREAAKKNMRAALEIVQGEDRYCFEIQTTLRL